MPWKTLLLLTFISTFNPHVLEQGIEGICKYLFIFTLCYLLTLASANKEIKQG